MLKVDNKDDNQQAGIDKKDNQFKSQTQLPEEKTEDESGHTFYQRKPERYLSLAGTAASAQPEIAQNRNQIGHAQFTFTGRAVRRRTDDGLSQRQSINADIEKAADE